MSFEVAIFDQGEDLNFDFTAQSGTFKRTLRAWKVYPYVRYL